MKLLDLLTKGSATRKRWTMWQLSTTRVVFFAIAPDGNSDAGRSFLEGFSGIALGDAAAIHKSMVRNSEYRLALCMAHASRKFIKAEANEPIRARQFIEMVQELYAIEDQSPPGPTVPGAQRRSHAARMACRSGYCPGSMTICDPSCPQ